MNYLHYTLAAVALASSSHMVNAQESAADQNPNHSISAEKYDQLSNTTETTQGKTIQETYKAYDWREAKTERRQLRSDRRYEIRKLRLESRNRYYRGMYRHNGFYPPYNGCYGSSFAGSMLGAGLGLLPYYLLSL